MSRRRVIDEAKAKVPVIDLADHLCGPGKMRRIGAEWVGRCPLPNHEDKTPSFCVNPKKNLWWCHGCLRGDVVELARFAWVYEKPEVMMAAADLLHEFGYSIPERPASWHSKQVRQKPIRDAIDEAKIRHIQRRIFRIFRPLLEQIENETERREEIEYLWDAAEEIAICIWAGRTAS